MGLRKGVSVSDGSPLQFTFRLNQQSLTRHGSLNRQQLTHFSAVYLASSHAASAMIAMAVPA
jgi:hypothetical protein